MKSVAFHILPQALSAGPEYDESMLGGGPEDGDEEEELFQIQNPVRDLLYSETLYSEPNRSHPKPNLCRAGGGRLYCQRRSAG